MTRQPPIFEVDDLGVEVEAIGATMAERGFCMLRGLFSPNLLDACDARIATILEAPAIAGTVGYAKTDHPKRVANPFSAGGPVVDLLLDERVIDVVEKVMGSECILAEAILKQDRATPYVYFPLHSDFSLGWTKSNGSSFSLTREDMEFPIGIGGVVYLHNTSDGAFCYSDGSHLLMSPHGQQLGRYPEDQRRIILDRCVRCDGRRGDLVLFDDRGFHGPDQPSRSDRLVILLDYYRVATFGRTQVTPMPVWSSDLGRLSSRQIKVLGAGADYMVAPQDYTGTRFKRNRMYPMVRWLIDHSYLPGHLIRRLRNRIKTIVR